ncbi:MAG: hypothetical protein Kow00128_20880 [Deltaproteobacteria bacterium]
MKRFDEAFYQEKVNTFPFIKLMGMRLQSAQDGKSVMECRVRPVLRNSFGMLHGGVLGALVDVSIATALRSILPLSRRMTTIEYKVNFLKPVFSGTVTAHGTILRLGSTIASGTSEIRNAEGEAVAYGSATFFLFEAKEGKNRSGIIGASTRRGRSGK